MFAIIAAICFLLGLFEVDLGELSSAKFVILGLFFIALQLIVPAFWPLATRRREQ